MKRLFALIGIVLALAPIAVSADISDSAHINQARAGQTYTFTLNVKNLTPDTLDYDIYYETGGFAVVGQAPSDGAAKGYTNIGSKVSDWVKIGTSNPGQTYTQTVGAGKIVGVSVTLTIPKGEVLPDKWAFWVSSKPNTGGNIIYESSCTILVSMLHANIAGIAIGGGIVGVVIVLVVILAASQRSVSKKPAYKI
jgi:hypothetical protein